MNKEPSFVVVAPVETADSAQRPERRHAMKLTCKGSVIDENNRVHSKGDTVTVGESRAIALYSAGAAVPVNPVTHALLWALYEPGEAPAPRPAESPAQKPNAEMVRGTTLVGSINYGPSHGPFFYPGDLIMRLAEQDPVPGSLTEIYVQRLGRNRPVFKAAYKLTPAELRRLENLRRSPDEPTEAQIANAKHVIEMASA
jgi:hypothetical protein